MARCFAESAFYREAWIVCQESSGQDAACTYAPAFSLRGDTMTEHRSGSLKHQSLGLELALGEVFGILDQN